MNTYLLVGNAIMLIGAILMCIIGLIKNRKAIILTQSVQIVIMTIGNLVLGSISGTVANFVGLIRNLLCYFEKLNKLSKTIIILISIAVILPFNNLGWIGFLPLVVTVVYTWFMDVKSVKWLKLLIIATTILWTIHDFYIKAYIIIIFDILTIVTNVISLRKVSKSEEK